MLPFDYWVKTSNISHCLIKQFHNTNYVPSSACSWQLVTVEYINSALPWKQTDYIAPDLQVFWASWNNLLNWQLCTFTATVALICVSSPFVAGSLLCLHHPVCWPSMGCHYRPHSGLPGLPKPMDTFRTDAALVRLVFYDDYDDLFLKLFSTSGRLSWEYRSPPALIFPHLI